MYCSYRNDVLEAQTEGQSSPDNASKPAPDTDKYVVPAVTSLENLGRFPRKTSSQFAYQISIL